MKKIFVIFLSALGITCMMSTPSHAHLVTTGLGPLYDGIAHFAMSPDDIFLTIAFALYAGLRGPAFGRVVLFILPTSWIIAGIVGLFLPIPLSIETWLPAVLLIIAGLVLATEVKLPLWATGLCVGLAGVLRGLLNGASLANSNDGKLVILGIGIVIFVLTALVSSLAVPIRRAWLRIAVRVVGSWTSALGLLLIGWTFRAKH